MLLRVYESKDEADLPDLNVTEAEICDRLNEEMIETLFMANSNGNGKDGVRRQLVTEASQENLVLNPKKSQNIAILLRALNVTVDEVCEALVEGEERVFISPVFAFCVCRDVFLIVVLKHWILVLSCLLLCLFCISYVCFVESNEIRVWSMVLCMSRCL